MPDQYFGDLSLAHEELEVRGKIVTLQLHSCLSILSYFGGEGRRYTMAAT